ncbi:MAG: anti-sigma regulatory factor [Nitriliruptorales bacterium]|nr:anti-sigma regulatory factor [Nitriliruptorales bacterium]
MWLSGRIQPRNVTVPFDLVTVTVPATANHLAVLRTAVGGFAARDQFTLDQVDDLRMAVEEAAVQLLRHSRGDRISMDVETTDNGVEVRLTGNVADDDSVIDESSFSWTILRALADAIRIESNQGETVIVLSKNRLVLDDEATGELP